jgi:Tol biopolymer transport system component
MYEMPAAGGARHKIAPGGNRAAVSPDGTKIAYSVHTDGCGSTELVVQELASGSKKTFSGSRSIDVGGWSADGRAIFLWAYYSSTPTIFRFGPSAPGAQLDDSQRWDTGIAADTGSSRVAIMDWCTGQTPECVVGLRSRSDAADQPDYSFGRVNAPGQMSIDTTGQWPLIVTDNPPGQRVSFFADGKWQELAPGNAADW